MGGTRSCTHAARKPYRHFFEPLFCVYRVGLCAHHVLRLSPRPLTLGNLRCKRADLTSLPFADESVDSLSCMHVVEHIGLERYGDPFSPQGDIAAMRELARVLGRGGRLLFAVPIGGVAKIHYNAHRIYTYSAVLEAFGFLLSLIHI